MPAATWLTSYQKGQIVALHRYAHWSIDHISNTLSILKSSVYRICLQSEHGDPITPPRPKGRKAVCSTRKRRRLIDRLSTDSFHRRLRLDQISDLEGFDFCTRTLIIALAKEGYHRRIARKKPWLTDAHKAARLKWAQEHVNWSDRQWQNVVWTDEAAIRVGYFGQVYVTRTANEELHEDCLAAKFRSYSSCMIWGCITAEGPQKVHIFDQGSVNGAVYRSQVVPLIKEVAQKHQNESLFRQKPVIMQDNCRIHTARNTLALFN